MVSYISSDCFPSRVAEGNALYPCRKVRFRLHSSDERQNLYGKQYSGNMIGAEGSLPGQFP